MSMSSKKMDQIEQPCPLDTVAVEGTPKELERRCPDTEVFAPSSGGPQPTSKPGQLSELPGLDPARKVVRSRSVLRFLSTQLPSDCRMVLVSHRRSISRLMKVTARLHPRPLLSPLRRAPGLAAAGFFSQADRLSLPLSQRIIS